MVKANSIKEYCEGIVGDSYSLLNTCIDNEKESKAKIFRRSSDPKIFNYCKKIVGESWSLMDTCINNEMKSKGELERKARQSGGTENLKQGSPDLRNPKDHNIEWLVSIETDPMTDEETRIVGITNAEGHTFGLIQSFERKSLVINGIFSLSKESPDQLTQKKASIYRIDKYKAFNVNKLKKLQKILPKAMEVTFYRWTPTSELFRVYSSDSKKLEEKLDDKNTLVQMLTGEKILFRYFLKSGGFKDTEFTLDGANKAILKVFSNMPRIKKWAEEFNN